MKKIFKTWLANEGNDKLAHLYAGNIIVLFIGLPLHYVSQIGLLIGLIAGISIGALKELLWDKAMGKGVCSLWDFIATGFGSLVMYILLLMITNSIEGNGVATGLFDR